MSVPLEIERKYLIEYPNIEKLNSLENCDKIEIVQTYLVSNDGETLRVRQTFSNGKYTYYLTSKRKVTGITRIELEKEISKEEYLERLHNKDKDRRPIIKDRYKIYEDNHCFEIDVYPFWNDKAIMEVELSSEDEKFVIPNIINVIREVTGEVEYLNSTLAKQF